MPPHPPVMTTTCPPNDRALARAVIQSSRSPSARPTPSAIRPGAFCGKRWRASMWLTARINLTGVSDQIFLRQRV